MKQLVGQRHIFKISTERLRRAKWNLTVSVDMAKKMDEVISLADSQLFRFVDALMGNTKHSNTINKYIVAIVSKNKSDFKRACKGITINGIKYKRFVGTTGGVKKNTVIFVSEEVYEALLIKANNGRDTNKKLVPAKFEAYKALMCSSSIPVSMPKGILVVDDVITKFKDKVIYVDDTRGDRPIVETIDNFDVELNATDGFGLCTPRYAETVANDLGIKQMVGGFNLRGLPFSKGMIYPYDLISFAEEVGGTYTVKDIWGDTHDIRDIELVLTSSMLKLWDSYDSINHYIKCCKENGYTMAVAKVVPHKLEDVRELNYQYLQSFKMSDEDILSLVKPTIDWLKDSMCGDYKKTLKFLGVDDNTPRTGNMDFIQALIESEEMMKDPFVVKKVHRLIKKKIDNAKIGKIRCEGNYQIASGDPYILAQSIFGLDTTGLLGRGEFYSSYWVDRGVDEILIFRSPMTSHNNITKCKIKHSDECNKWYKYMKNVIIFNAWDNTMSAQNGEDFDGDQNFTTNNSILLKNYIKMPPIVCVQRTADKYVITDELLQISNENGFGNDVGTITNRVTSQFEVLSNFEQGTKEYNEIEYRIICGQLYQQNSIDKIKGVKTTPMPKHWYDFRACKDDFDRSTVATKKPKFMIYIYPNEMNAYVNYIEKVNRKSRMLFECDIDTLIKSEDKTEEQETFLNYYYNNMPVGLGDCICNKICSIVENEFSDFPPYKEMKFDTSILKSDTKYTKSQFKKVQDVYSEYKKEVSDFKIKAKKERIDKDSSIKNREMFKTRFKEKAIVACKDAETLCNIVVDLCYTSHNSKQFAWDVACNELISNIRRNTK